MRGRSLVVGATRDNVVWGGAASGVWTPFRRARTPRSSFEEGEPRPFPHQMAHAVDPVGHARKRVILEQSMLIDEQLTCNAARMEYLIQRGVPIPNSPSPLIQWEKDLITILSRMDQQLSNMDASTSPRSKVTAQIAELARQSSDTVGTMMAIQGVAPIPDAMLLPRRT